MTGPITAGAVPEYDALVEKHGLSILLEPGDFSIEDDALLMTKDGGPQIGDAVYSATFRLVQAWRYSRPHLNQVFALCLEMAEARRRHAEETEKIALETQNTCDPAQSAPDHFAPLRDAFEASEAIELGQKLYAACSMLVLSSFHLANQRIGFLRFCAWADSRGVWHGGKVFGYGER
jgi:hypothetical protein